MKHYLLLVGGFTGFALAFATGIVVGNDIGQVLFNASIGCMIGAFLFRWISDLYIECIVQQRRRSAANAAAEAAAAAPAKGARR